MSVLTVVILIFSAVGAVDWLIGNKLGAGKEFERAFSLFAPMALSMLGMIVLAPAIGVWLTPLLDGFYNLFGVDPSVVPASLLANDMGGMAVAQAVCRSEEIGNFNAYVVSSMMGCLISFTLPFSLGLVKREQHNELFFGILCGITTIPVGCFAAGLLCGLSPLALLIDLLPLILLSAIIGASLFFCRRGCIRCFSAFGWFMRLLSLAGLVCAIFTFLTKKEIYSHFDSFQNAAFVCANACVTLSGALPFMYLITKLLGKPLDLFGSQMGVNRVSALALLGSLVTNASTFGMMERMDKKGVVLNSAFAVSASFAFGSHLAFTMAYDSSYVFPMITGKVISGIFAVLMAFVLYRDKPQGREVSA